MQQLRKKKKVLRVLQLGECATSIWTENFSRVTELRTQRKPTASRSYLPIANSPQGNASRKSSNHFDPKLNIFNADITGRVSNTSAFRRREDRRRAGRRLPEVSTAPPEAMLHLLATENSEFLTFTLFSQRALRFESSV